MVPARGPPPIRAGKIGVRAVRYKNSQPTSIENPILHKAAMNTNRQWHISLRAMRVIQGTIAACLLGGMPMLAHAQSNNIMAQGFYYRAKSLYEAGSHREALPYIARSKQTLGGTNITLQYLHVMTLVGANDFIAANAELQRFFSLTDKSIPAVPFTNMVDRLTDEEQRQLTRVMVEIMEKADGQGAAKVKEAKYAEVLASVDRILASVRNFSSSSMMGGFSREYQVREYTYRNGSAVNVGRGLLASGRSNAWTEQIRTSVGNIERIEAFETEVDKSKGLRFFFVNAVQVPRTGRYVTSYGMGTRNGVIDFRDLRAEVDRFNALIREYRSMR